MEKFVIEDALYLFESIKENKMISYDDNLINSNNNKINNDKLAYIGKNIKGFDGLDSSSILSLNIQRFAQRESTLPKVKEKITSNSYIDVTNDWVEKSKGINKKIKIFQKNEIFEYNGKKYLVDNHYVKYRENINREEELNENIDLQWDKTTAASTDLGTESHNIIINIQHLRGMKR